MQVAANCPNRAPNSLLGTMARLADEADTDNVGFQTALLSVLFRIFNAAAADRRIGE